MCTAIEAAFASLTKSAIEGRELMRLGKKNKVM